MKRLMLLILALGVVAAAQPFCTIQTIVGTYTASYSGWLTMDIPGAAPMNIFGTILGVVSIDYAGKIAGVVAISGLGPVTDYEVSGTVELKPDCTGTIRQASKPKGSTEAAMAEVHRFVFIPSEKKILATIVDMGPGMYPALLGEYKWLSPTPNAVNW